MENTTFWGLLRKKAGLSQEQFAAKSGISVDMVRSMEIGRKHPSLETATKAAAVLDADPVELLVAHRVEVARKSVEQGAGRGGVLHSAAKLCDLVEAADSPRDARALTLGAEELLSIARSSATKSADDEDDVDAFGRKTEKLYGPKRAEPAERDAIRAELGRVGDAFFEQKRARDARQRAAQVEAEAPSL